MPKLEVTSTNRIPQYASGGGGCKVPHLKCFYIDAHKMRKEQEELEALNKSQRSDTSDINETWWDESCVWSALMNGYMVSSIQAGEETRIGGTVSNRRVRMYGAQSLQWHNRDPPDEESRGKQIMLIS